MNFKTFITFLCLSVLVVCVIGANHSTKVAKSEVMASTAMAMSKSLGPKLTHKAAKAVNGSTTASGSASTTGSGTGSSSTTSSGGVMNLNIPWDLVMITGLGGLLGFFGLVM